MGFETLVVEDLTSQDDPDRDGLNRHKDGGPYGKAALDSFKRLKSQVHLFHNSNKNHDKGFDPLRAGPGAAHSADGAATGNPGADAERSQLHARAAGAPGRRSRRRGRRGYVIALLRHDAAALHPAHGCARVSAATM